jgi:glycosyltransferase involved in cell wall biosynthesis
MSRKYLRILFVTPYVPATVRLRPYSFITQLSKRGHSITVACLVQPKWEINYVKDVKPFCQAIYPILPNKFYSYMNIFTSMLSNVPFSVTFSTSSVFQKVIFHILKESKFDLIHTEFIRAAQYTAKIEEIPKLFDAVDSLTLAYDRALKNRYTRFAHRVLAFEEWLKMRNYEPHMLRYFDRAIVSSPADRAYLTGNGTPVDVVSNGVDLEYFRWFDCDKETNSIVFLGKMNYYVNIDSIYYFYKFIYPKIKSQLPKVHLTIIGWNPSHSILALSRDPTIEVTGGVPDVRPYLAKATIAIAPMVSGSGIQNKILQAMAVGTPVVTTSLACQALHVINGDHLLVADTPEDFAGAVTGLLRDKALQKKLSLNARRYVEEFHNWEVIGRQLEEIYIDLVQ